MSEKPPWVHALDDAGGAWPLAEFLASSPIDDDIVTLNGRQIEAERLVECWRFLFGT